MTEVFQMLEKEKQEAIKLAEQKTITRVAENLIKDEVDTVIIMRATGLSEEEIEEIKKSIQEQYANNKEGYLSIKKSNPDAGNREIGCCKYCHTK